MSIGRQDKPHGQGFNRILAIVALVWLAAAPAFGQRLSPLAARPAWPELERFQQTMTRDEFVRLLQTLYAPAGGWESFITVGDDRAWLVTDSKNPSQVFELRFAVAPKPARITSGFWRTRAQIRRDQSGLPSSPGRPLDGLRIALDPGHLGGEWAQMEERWFQIGDAPPVKEGEMTLAVAKMMAPRLEALGATVMWVRRENGPVTTTRPEGMLDIARGALIERGVTDTKDNYAGPADPDREKSIQWEAERLFYRISEIRTRARLVNDVLQPDVTLCLHFNAEEWGDPAKPALVEKNHLHLLVSGNFSAAELRYDDVRFEMLTRLLSRVHEEEIPLAETVASTLARATALPPYEYTDGRAIRVGPSPYVWARNLLANRLYRCPVIYCEPYVMNSPEVFARVQAGDYEGLREVAGRLRPSIVREYADAVVAGLLDAYGK
jgi:hypothetical protein